MAVACPKASSPALHPTPSSAIKPTHIIVVASLGFQVFSTHLDELGVENPVAVSTNHPFNEVGGRDAWCAAGGDELA